jgi:hypothetical protein
MSGAPYGFTPDKARELATRTFAVHPTIYADDSWNSKTVHTVRLGKMLATVSVIPQIRNDIAVTVSGDKEMIGKLQLTVTDGVLTLDGAIPYTDPHSRSGGTTVFGGTSNKTIVFNSVVGGRNIVGDNIIVGGDIDLERAIDVCVVIPLSTDVHIQGTVGAVGIGANPEGSLTVNLSGWTTVCAIEVNSADVGLSGSANVAVDKVNGSATIGMSGSSEFESKSIHGAVKIDKSGSSTVYIEGGTSSRLTVQKSGSGSVHHLGTVNGPIDLSGSGSGVMLVAAVNGDASFSISGSGRMTVKELNGSIRNLSISGSAEVIVNGETYDKLSQKRQRKQSANTRW